MEIEPVQPFQIHLVYLAFVSFFLCLVLMALARGIPRLQGRADDTTAVQAMHLKMTPRVGGVAIFGALACSLFFAPEAIVRQYAEFIIATALIFFVGLAEDLGFRIAPRIRLLAVVLASLLVIALIGEWLSRVGLPIIDPLLELWFIGVPFTLLITAGVTNGFNLIDGINGLAAVTAIGAAIAISVIAQQAGYLPAAVLCIMMAAVVSGFFLLNYPYGLIFLGDAGAYTIGFVLCWFGIATVLNAPDVSPWAILLTMFWPLADTLLAMYRRSRSNRDAMLPDRLHMHQLVMRGIEIRILGRNKRDLSNSLTTAVLAPFVLIPPMLGVLLWDNNMAAFLAVLLLLALFPACYAIVVRLVLRRGRHA